MNIQHEICTTSIPLMTRIKAEQFRRYQSQAHKAKQVYLNTLAVSAVNSYLNSIGWATNLENSDSWNPLLQTMMDVADLNIPSYGKLECRVVLSHKDSVMIPPEVWSERIGYVVVELDKFLTTARLLGFIPQVSQTKLLLSQLESMAKFPAYLSQQKRTFVVQPARLSRWLSGFLDTGWRQLEELFPPAMTLNFRSLEQTTSESDENLALGASRVKLVNLGDCDNNNDNNIALVLNIFPQRSEEFNISVKICPASNHNFLPQGLELVILDEAQHPVMFAQANDTENIEFCFSGKLGEYFSIEVSLDNHIKLETFII
jgi:hypothetical protein